MENGSSEHKTPQTEIEESLTRLFKDVITTFGTNHPDELPMDDPALTAIYEQYYDWINVQAAEAERIGSPEAHLEMSLKVTPFLVEAGFTHPDYVEEVANEFLDQDLAQAEELGLSDLVDRIRTKQEELLRLI